MEAWLIDHAYTNPPDSALHGETITCPIIDLNLIMSDTSHKSKMKKSYEVIQETW